MMINCMQDDRVIRSSPIYFPRLTRHLLLCPLPFIIIIIIIIIPVGMIRKCIFRLGERLSRRLITRPISGSLVTDARTRNRIQWARNHTIRVCVCVNRCVYVSVYKATHLARVAAPFSPNCRPRSA